MREPVHFAHGLGLHFFGHAGGFQFLAQVIDVARRFVPFAQFLLDGLQLFAQVELPLALGKLALHLRLNPAAQLQQFELAGEVAVDLAQPDAAIQLLEKALALGGAEGGQVPRDEVRHPPGLADLGRGRDQVVGQVGAGFHDLLKQADNVLPQGLDFRCHLRLDLGKALDPRLEERLGGSVLAGPYARDALAKQQQVLARHADYFVDHANGADLVQIFGLR